MSSVTIEGSLSPSVFLGRGQRRTVQLTDRVQRMIDRGFVTVVDGRTVTEREADDNAAAGRAALVESKRRRAPKPVASGAADPEPQVELEVETDPGAETPPAVPITEDSL